MNQNDFITDALQKEVAKEALKNIDIPELGKQVAVEYTKALKKACKINIKSIDSMMTEEDFSQFFDGFFNTFNPYQIGQKAGRITAKQVQPKDFLDFLTNVGDK